MTDDAINEDDLRCEDDLKELEGVKQRSSRDDTHKEGIGYARYYIPADHNYHHYDLIYDYYDVRAKSHHDKFQIMPIVKIVKFCEDYITTSYPPTFIIWRPILRTNCSMIPFGDRSWSNT